MIAADLRFEGFDALSWTHLVSLFMPGLPDRMNRDEAPAHSSTLVIVEDDEGTILSALHGLRGPVSSLIGTSTGELARLAHENGAARTLVLRVGVMEELAERLGLATRSGEDYVAQWIGVLRSVRARMDAGQIRLWPNPIANVPIPPPATVSRALDLVLPKERAAVFALFERRDGEEALWTTAVIRRRHDGDLDLVAGPDLVLGWTGPLGGDWRRDYRVIVDAVSRAVAPVHLGIFGDVESFREVLRAGDPGTWAREVAVRNLVVHPMPRAVGLALGADAIRGLGRASARALGGLDVPGTLLPLAERLRARWTQVRTVTDELGFDPLRVLAAALRREDTED